VSDADLNTLLDALQRARMRRDEGDAAQFVLDELLDHTCASAARLRAAPPRRQPPRNERSWAELDNDRRSTL
jgi:hypothetical protein